MFQEAEIAREELKTESPTASRRAVNSHKMICCKGEEIKKQPFVRITIEADFASVDKHTNRMSD